MTYDTVRALQQVYEGAIQDVLGRFGVGPVVYLRKRSRTRFAINHVGMEMGQKADCERR